MLFHRQTRQAIRRVILLWILGNRGTMLRPTSMTLPPKLRSKFERKGRTLPESTYEFLHENES